MKKVLVSAVAILLVLALGVCALAESVYIKKDKVKIYSKASTKGKVIATLNGNDEVTWEDEIGGWTQISFKVKGKRKTGWVQNKYISYEPVPSHCKHKWGDWEIRTKATCKRTGYKVRYCKKCGMMEEKDIPKTDHTYGKWTVTKKATCTKTGEKVRECKVCGHEQVEKVPKAEHEYGKWTVTEEPTCTETGSHYRKCKVCGYKDVEVMKKLPHEWGKWTVLREPTCTKAGKRIHTCEVCGYEEEQSIEKLPHDFEWQIVEEATDHSSGIRAQVCTVCGETEDPVSYDPEGTLRRNDRGDAVKEVQQLLVDQGYLNAGGADGVFGGGTEKAIMQFQKDQGLEPDGVAWPQTIKRLKHDFGPWEIVKPLTRTESGERMRVCKDCGFIQRETLEAGTTYARKDRGEPIRAMQQILKQLGYNAGAFDGIYGGKLDAAFSAFAADHGLEFHPGKVCPADVDVLMNAWFEATGEDSWKGEGTVDSPVNLALTVTPASDSDEDEEIRTFNWSLTNLGTEPCMFNALLLTYSDESDFKQDNLVVVLDGIELKANCANSASGTFSVAADWGEGPLDFAAMAVVEKTGDKWLSNAVTFDSDLSEAA